MKEGSVLVWVVMDVTVDGGETGDPYRQVLDFKDAGLKLHDTMIWRKRGSNGLSWKNRHCNGFEFMFVFSKGRPKTVNIIKDVPAKYAGKRYPSTYRKKDGSMSIRNKDSRIIPKFVSRDNVWSFSHGRHNSAESSLAHDHPAIFPLKLAQDHIKTWTNEGDLVLDPMAGSGTVLYASRSLGRRSVGIDTYEPYCDLMVKRMKRSGDLI